jgi:hypothetical protein
MMRHVTASGTADQERIMTPEDWFEQLDAALPGAAEPISEAERVALLDLARIAARASERWTAPVTTFIAGVALTRAPDASRESALRALVDALAPFEPTDSETG